MIKKIHHIAVAVKNLEESLEIYCDLFGLRPKKIEILAEQKVKTAIIRLGETEIEFLEPLDVESPIAKFIEKRGEGLHHIAFEVKNINRELKKLSGRGAELIDKKARKGLAGKIAFLHPKSAKGVLIELVQKPEAK